MSILKVINNLIDMPKHKLESVIHSPTLVTGLRNTFSHYGITYTQEVHELLVEAVQEKLEGSNMEREWSEEEYNAFVKFN